MFKKSQEKFVKTLTGFLKDITMYFECPPWWINLVCQWIENTHWGETTHFIQKSHFENVSFDKIQLLKTPIFTKFTFLKSRLSQNSPFWNLIFHKIHIFGNLIFHKINTSEISFITKFTFLKYRNQGNFWIKSGVLP